MATRYPDGTLESGMEQRDDTRDDDTVTNEGENQKDICTDAMPTAKSEIVSEVDPLSGTIRVKCARETSANESVVHLHPSEPESGQEPSCDSDDSDTPSQTDADEKVPSSYDTQHEESKIEHKDTSCDPDDSDTPSQTDADEKVPSSYDTQHEESKFYMESKFSDPKPEENKLASSPQISDSTSLLSDEASTEFPEKAEENLLQGKLLSLNLSKEAINILLEYGEKFLEKPLLLSKKLNIDVEKAKVAIEALKSFKSQKTTNYISENDRMLIEDCLKDSPEFSNPEDIALLINLPLQTVILYLQNRHLDDRQKADIKKKVNIGISVKDIAAILNLSPNKVQEYVENTFLTFTGVEGKRCWDIIRKYFSYSSTIQLRKLIISNDLKLQDQLCYILLKRNEREYVALKKYFHKFEESKSFFEIKQTHLSIDDIHQINQSTDIEYLSVKLNKPASIIRDYLALYKPNQVVMEQSEIMQKFHIQELLVNYRTEQKLPFQSYRMIVTHRFEDMMERAQTRQYPLQVFEELLPLAFYYLKCSLPFTEINQMFVSTGKSKLTTHELFHLIFQQSDPVLKAFCIEHYSFSNPVPFHYPNLHTANLNQFQVEFAICSELWYSIQHYNGLISFGLGRASWNPIGKSRLLDMIFETDFVRGNPQNSAFHSNSIDIQMTNNLFGEKTQEHADESIKWAFFDCHGHSNRDLIRLICQQLDIALIQVCFQDFLNHKGTFRKQVSDLTNSVKHVYIFIRDYNEVGVNVDMTNSAYKLIYIPNLTKSETNIDSVKQSVRSIGYEMLHLNSENTKTLGNEFIEKVMDKIDGANIREIMVEKVLIRKIIDCAKKSTLKVDFPFLHYYPLFVDYMSCYYQASNETDKNIIDRLNSESAILHTKLSNTKVGEVVKHFSRIIERENSSLIMWRLSQMLAQFTNQVTGNENTSKEINKYSLEILWREVLLSSKYGKFDEEGREEFLRSFALSYSNHVERGEPFELIDGDNLRYFNQDINSLLANMYQTRRDNLEATNTGRDIKIKEAPIVVSIFGPQSSGKSTLLNYCFGCKFLTSTGRCTRGIYASLAKLSRPVNCSDQFLILDTEGLDAIGRGHNKDNTIIQFDRTMVLFCLAVSQVVIINVKGEIGREMQNLLHICAYSLNKLKVRRVTAPQIFFVLNQQADPNITNHLNDINILMEKLNNELVDTEGNNIIVSELIQVSPKNVFILPSAFNAENFNKHSLKLFDSKVIKLSPTTVFADKCADLRMAIIDKLDNMPIGERTSFETMSDWLEISGTIWDTIIKYQDIVKYGNIEEMMCSDLLRKIISELMDKHIYAHKQEFVERTEKVSSEIREMNILGKIDDTLRDILEEFGEFFQPYTNSCLTAYKERCQTDTLLKNMNYLSKEYELNLTRIMYVQYTVYEDKIKFQISAVKIEKKIHESMKNFQKAIITNIDSYSKQSVEEQKSTFEQTWTDCFEDEDCGEEVELNDTFERLYSLFKMELRAMENKTEILSTFRTGNYIMENIIGNIEIEILVGFLGNADVHGEKHFVFPIMENNIPLRAMTPFPTKPSYQYLAPDCLYRIVKDRTKRKTKIKLVNEVPKECKSLVKHCSGYYNYPDVQWKGWRMDRQIFHLVSLLKSPRNPQMITWKLLIEDIATVNKFIDHDPTVSPGTIKEIINHLYSIFQVVNYELSFIQARMTNTAERMISKLVFAYAFKSVWETKKQNRLEHDLKTEVEKNVLLQYFLQKIGVRKMFRGNMDREAMKMTDLKFSEKFGRDLLGAVKRGIISAEETSIQNFYNERKEELSHKTLLLCGTAKVSVELNNKAEEENTDGDNFVVRYICDRNVELRKMFFQKWEEIQEQIHSQLVTGITNKCNKQLEPLKGILRKLLDDLVESRDKAGSSEDKAFDSDNNFEKADTCVFDSIIEIKQGPSKAMAIYLQKYLDPSISPEEFTQFFLNEFVVDGIKMKKSDTYSLCSKSINNPNYILDQELFNKLNYTEMFSSDNIFNISDYVTEFLSVLDSSFSLTEEDFMKIVKPIKDKFEKDAIGCPKQCPGCGKLCEREIHTNDGLCQLKTGHQICSMGGKVWNYDDKTAVLYMCDDYQDHTNVIIQGKKFTWARFKNIWGDQWDWTMPTDKEYLALQSNNRQIIRNIWNKFGKGILNYYHFRGTSISFVPYTSSHDLFNSLTLKYYICFVIDGTVSMATVIKKTRISVGQFISRYQELAYNSEFRVVIYRDHCDKHILEKFPKHNKFTPQHTAVQDFLSSVQAVGGGDFPEAVLDGLATAATESLWEYTPGIKNVIIHIYDAPPHGNFPNYTSHDSRSNKKHCCCCNHGTRCPFDWDRDVWNNFKKFNIHYYGINTGKRIPEFETTMKAKLEDLCGEFLTVGEEMVNDAVLEIFIRI